MSYVGSDIIRLQMSKRIVGRTVVLDQPAHELLDGPEKVIDGIGPKARFAILWLAE